MILRDYFIFIKSLNEFYKELKKDDFFKINQFNYFDSTFDFGIKKIKNAEVDDFSFKRILDYLDFQIAKLNFLCAYKKKLLSETTKKNAELLVLAAETYEKQKDKTIEIIDFKQLISSGVAPLEFEYTYKNGFETKNGFIYPNFKKIKKLEFEKAETYGKILLRFKEPVFLSSVNLVFKKNIQSDIYVSYKKKGQAENEFVSEPIKLSKVKMISLNFDDCYEVIFSSTEPFNNFLADLTCFGGTDNSEFTSGYGVLKLNSDLEFTKLLVLSDINLNFFAIKSKIFNELQRKNDFIDFENNNNFIKLENNLNNLINFNSEYSLIFAFSTASYAIPDFKIYGSGD